LLFNIKEAQELYYAQLRYNYKIKRSNNVIKHFLQNNCNYIFIVELKQYNVKSKNIDVSSNNSFYLNNDNSIYKA